MAVKKAYWADKSADSRFGGTIVSLKFKGPCYLTAHLRILGDCPKLLGALEPTSPHAIDLSQISVAAGHYLVEHLYTKSWPSNKWLGTGNNEPSATLKTFLELYSMARQYDMPVLKNMAQYEVESSAARMNIFTMLDAFKESYPIPVAGDTWIQGFIKSRVRTAIDSPAAVLSSTLPTDLSDGVPVVKFFLQGVFDAFAEKLEFMNEITAITNLVSHHPASTAAGPIAAAERVDISPRDAREPLMADAPPVPAPEAAVDEITQKVGISGDLEPQPVKPAALEEAVPVEEVVTVEGFVPVAEPLQIAEPVLTDNYVPVEAPVAREETLCHEATTAAETSPYFGRSLPAEKILPTKPLVFVRGRLASEDRLLMERYRAGFRPYHMGPGPQPQPQERPGFLAEPVSFCARTLPAAWALADMGRPRYAVPKSKLAAGEGPVPDPTQTRTPNASWAAGIAAPRASKKPKWTRNQLLELGILEPESGPQPQEKPASLPEPGPAQPQMPHSLWAARVAGRRKSDKAQWTRNQLLGIPEPEPESQRGMRPAFGVLRFLDGRTAVSTGRIVPAEPVTSMSLPASPVSDDGSAVMVDCVDYGI